MPKFPSARPSPSLPIGRPEVLFARAKQARLEGRNEEAIDLYRRVLVIDPLNSEAMIQLGAVFGDEGRLVAAIGLFNDSLRIDPTQPLPWALRGIALEKIGNMMDALASYDRVVALRPDDPKPHLARASVLFNMGRFEEAIAVYDRIEPIVTDRAEFAVNRAAVLQARGRTTEALLDYDRAIALDPSNARAYTQMAFTVLLRGDLKRGFDLYEWRHKLPEVMKSWRRFSEPLWLGDTNAAGKTLLLYHEQGFGDTIQFCRYAKLAANAGARVVLDVPKPLAELMATVAGISQIVVEGDPLPDFDLRCPLMSLPRAFSTTIENIPANIPYLQADPHRVTAWRDRLSHLRGRRIGLVWAGSSRLGDAGLVGTDQRRSLTLMALGPLASVSATSFVSLQLGQPSAQIVAPPSGMVLYDPTSELENFADTAALIEVLDLVISVDTAVAHLAGALGKPVWLLNRFDTCWRWLLDRDDSPWYPTLRQFRQTSPGDWDGVITRVAEALGDFRAS